MLPIYEFIERIKPVAKSISPNGDCIIEKMFGAYQREAKKIEEEHEVKSHIYERYRNDCILYKVFDNMYIVKYGNIFKTTESEWYAPYFDGTVGSTVYPSFDKALLALVAMKTKSESAVPYIEKMLGLDKEGENNV